MVNRPAGGARSQKWERSDYDFYREPRAAAEQLFEGIDFGDDRIWDPCCGQGNILDVAKARGHDTVGSDIIMRGAAHRFTRGNILSITRPPSGLGRALSVVTNPPFSYQPDIAERIIRKVLDFPVRRAAFIVPIAFLAGQDRYRFFTDLRPSHVCIYSQRHTMPPGLLIEDMGDAAYRGGMADYCAVVWTPPNRYRTETVWLRPSAA